MGGRGSGWTRRSAAASCLPEWCCACLTCGGIASGGGWAITTDDTAKRGARCSTGRRLAATAPRAARGSTVTTCYTAMPGSSWAQERVKWPRCPPWQHRRPPPPSGWIQGCQPPTRGTHAYPGEWASPGSPGEAHSPEPPRSATASTAQEPRDPNSKEVFCSASSVRRECQHRKADAQTYRWVEEGK